MLITLFSACIFLSAAYGLQFTTEETGEFKGKFDQKNPFIRTIKLGDSTCNLEILAGGNVLVINTTDMRAAVLRKGEIIYPAPFEQLAAFADIQVIPRLISDLRVPLKGDEMIYLGKPGARIRFVDLLRYSLKVENPRNLNDGVLLHVSESEAGSGTSRDDEPVRPATDAKLGFNRIFSRAPVEPHLYSVDADHNDNRLYIKLNNSSRAPDQVNAAVEVRISQMVGLRK